MSDITNVIRKELKELLTPGSVISVLIMVVLFAALGGLIGGEVEKAQALPVFGIANEDCGDIVLKDGSEWSAAGYLRDLYTGIPENDMDDYIKVVDISGVTDLYELMTSNGIDSLVVIDSTFADNVLYNMYEATSVADLRPVVIEEYYLYEPSGMFGSISSTAVSAVVSSMSSDLSGFLIKSCIEPDKIYQFLANPISNGGDNLHTIVNGEAHSGVTPQEISSQISSQTMMIPMIIMIIIMMVGSIVISSMGSEKENKTLETLLTLPIKRTSIVSGKIIAAAVVGLVYGLAYMVGMSIYMNAMMGPTASGVDLEALGLGLDMLDWVLVAASMFLAIICALGICMILGAFAKNYKSAQTMTMPLSILAMVPMFIIMFSGWYGSGAAIQAVTFAIPFSHPMMAMQSLMYSDYTLVFSGIAYMAVFALVTIMITVKLYNSDILITGLGQNKTVQKLTGRK